MAYFWSYKIIFCECMMPTYVAWEVMNRLGSLEVVALYDTPVNYNNPFAKSYRRCDEAVTKLQIVRVFLSELSHSQHKLKDTHDYHAVLKEFERDIEVSKAQGYLYMNQIEDEIHATHHYLTTQKKELDSFNRQLKDLILELALLITVADYKSLQSFFGGTVEAVKYKPFSSSDLELPDWKLSYEYRGTLFESKCVCINRSELQMLKRGLFRMTRGNSWVSEIDLNPEKILYVLVLNQRLKDYLYEFMARKIVCVIIYQSGYKNILTNKINNFLACMDCHIMRSNFERSAGEIAILKGKIHEIKSLEELTIEGIDRYANKLCTPKEHSKISWLTYMEIYTRKEREIYKALSLGKVNNSLMQFNIYLSSNKLPLHIQPSEALPPLTLNVRETGRLPPSKFDTNFILKWPQYIVNIYGVPSYTYINPAPFYIVTFGFFIGVMFGDVGHMLMTFPLLLYFKANAWFWLISFFMGYCGLIYNEFFGLNFGLFSSCYQFLDSQTIQYSEGCVYPLGIDSIWNASYNKMAFINSLKMKTAVIIGVVHMFLGLGLRLANNIKQKYFVDIFLLTLPQFLFLGATFLYMDLLIVMKWLTNYAVAGVTPPSIITTMIEIFVEFAQEKPDYILFWSTYRHFERFLLAVAVICIPIMLLGKPIAILIQKRHSPPRYENYLEEYNGDHVDLPQDNIEDKLSEEDIIDSKKRHFYEQPQEKEYFKYLMVHQLIQTIEYVLGSVSNTASYLRLWALSLAHAQLSEVIFELTILKFLKSGYASIVGLFIAFPFFFGVTYGVLICMDTMECFLHSLRLHWVEFQNKFYEGKGYAFVPFTFKSIVKP